MLPPNPARFWFWIFGDRAAGARQGAKPGRVPDGGAGVQLAQFELEQHASQRVIVVETKQAEAAANRAQI